MTSRIYVDYDNMSQSYNPGKHKALARITWRTKTTKPRSQFCSATLVGRLGPTD